VLSSCAPAPVGALADQLANNLSAPGKLVGVELEIAAHALEVGGAERGAQRVLFSILPSLCGSPQSISSARS